MRALVLADPVTDLATIKDVPEPTPLASEILVRVHATAVTPSELQWSPTIQTKDGSPRTHAIPSHELSGVIEAVGDDVDGAKPGDKVFGMNDWFADGAMAELVVTRKEWLAAKPESIRHTDAAALPISALTAWQGLVDRAALEAGETVLIHGGAGAVGVMAIQVAKHLRAKIIVTAKADQEQFLRKLGADQVIDYTARPFEKEISDVDVVFDTVGGETLNRSWDVLGKNGRLVTVAADSEKTTSDRNKKAFMLVEAKRAQLESIALLVAAGKLAPIVDQVITLDEAAEAYSGRLAKKSGRGKIVVNLDA